MYESVFKLSALDQEVIKKMVQSGQLVEAVTFIRKKSNIGLKTAKNIALLIGGLKPENQGNNVIIGMLVFILICGLILALLFVL